MNPLETLEFTLTELKRKRNDLDRSIIDLENSITTLRRVYVDEGRPVPTIAQLFQPADVGITDAVRGAFRLNADRRLTALQVRDVVASHGFDLSKYSNSMATIHQVIKRLLEGQELQFFGNGNEKTAYQWIGKTASATSLPPQVTPDMLVPQPSGITKFRVRPSTKGPLTGPEEIKKK